MDEAHLGALARWKRGESLDGVTHERMRKARHVSAGNLAVGEEGAVEIRDVHRCEHVFETRALRIPLAPRVDVGQPERGARWPGDFKRDDFAELLAVRNHNRSDGEIVGQPHRLASDERHDCDVVVLDELTPRAVCPQKLAHARHRVHRHRLRADRLVAEEHQPGVVAHVCVSEKDSVDDRLRGAARRAIELERLPAEIGRCVDHPALAAARIDDAQRRDFTRARRVVPARIAKAARLRNATVLRDAEHDQRRSARGNLRSRDLGARRDTAGEAERDQQGKCGCERGALEHAGKIGLARGVHAACMRRACAALNAINAADAAPLEAARTRASMRAPGLRSP